MFRSDRAMKTKTKPTPRARKMWANYYTDADGFVCLHGTRTCAKDNVAEDCLNAAIPVAVIPLDDPLIVPALAALGIRLSKGGCK